MGLPSILGGTQAAQATAAKPLSGAVAQGASSTNFTGAMQAAAAKSAGGAKGPSPADSQRAQNALNAFHQTLMQLMTDNKVDTSEALRLESDGQGGVQVAGDHADADKITAIFQEHPELVAQFQSLAQSFQQLRAADPNHKPDDSLNPPKFGITLTGQQVQATFA